MKQAIKKTKLAALALATAFAFGSTAVNAGTLSENPIEITYLGSSNAHPVFLLNLNNTEGQVFTVVIKDATGQVLFREKTDKSDFSRKYKLDIDDAEFRSAGFALKFEVTPGNSSQTETYTVSTATRVIEDVIIAKNK